MSEICAGIVTFQPEISRLNQNLSIVTVQADTVFVVDNNSKNLNEIKRLITSFSNVVLIENKHNNGIAKALNQMCAAAEKEGFEWILTLDQDTLIPSEMVSVFRNHISNPNIGVICPAVYYEGWNNNLKSKNVTEYVYACMTSASLTKVQAWKNVGGFREDYFIDFVDNEFCMKLGLNKYKVLRINACQINHQLGDSGIKKFLGLKIRYSRHSPLRLYYMARNNYSFIREYADHLPILKEWIKLIYVLGQGLLFSDTKREAIRFIKEGLRDARNGVSGEYRKDKGERG